MKVNNIGEARKGIGFGLISGATWGIDTVLVGIIMAKSPFIDTEKAVVLAPFVSTFLHDFFSAFWAALYMIFKGEIRAVIKSLKTRSGVFIMLGALLGGPVGMTCYLLSVKYIGAAYTATISSIYPGIGAVLAFLLLKEKLNSRIVLGIILSILGVITLGYVPEQLSLGSNFMIGMFFAFGTVLAWSLESVICAYGMKDGEVKAEHALNIRQATSALFYGIVILPTVNGYGLAASTLGSTTLVIIAAAALVGTASYLYYYTAIYTIGAARSTALNITYAVWALIIQVVFLKTAVSLQLIAGCITVVIGSILVAGNPKEMLRFKEVEIKQAG